MLTVRVPCSPDPMSMACHQCLAWTVLCACAVTRRYLSFSDFPLCFQQHVPSRQLFGRVAARILHVTPARAASLISASWCLSACALCYQKNLPCLQTRRFMVRAIVIKLLVQIKAPKTFTRGVQILHGSGLNLHLDFFPSLWREPRRPGVYSSMNIPYQ